MKLLILSYRANRTLNTSCSCHPHYRTEDSSFEMKNVEGLDEAAGYIYDRLRVAPHAEHIHVILEKMPGEIPYCDASEAILKKKDAGTLVWPNPYDEYDYEFHEERDAEQARIDGLIEELKARIYGIAVQKELGG